MRRMHASDDFAPLHALLTRCFAFMDGRINPPSSLTRMTPDDLRNAATTGEVWVIERSNSPVASATLTPMQDCLMVSKLAVDQACRGQGLARTLVEQAEQSARTLGKPVLRLQTRVELTENHATFAALGFVQTGTTAHPGFDRPTSITMEKPVPQ